MKWNISKALAAKALASGAVACAVCVGGTQLAAAYQAGSGYVPGSVNRAMQSNQLLFDQNGTAANAGEETKSEDSFWEKDDAGEQALNKGGDGGYLFSSAEEAAGGRNMTLQSTNAAVMGTGGGSTGDGDVYDIVGAGENADMTISGGDASANDQSDSTSSGGNNGGTDNSVTPTPAPDTPVPEPEPTPIPTPSKSETVADPDTSSGNTNNSEFNKGPEVSADIESEVKKVQLFPQNNSFYIGQKLDERTIFNLSVAVAQTSNSQIFYHWSAEQYGTLFRVDAVSFDGGETWCTEFPVQIPEGTAKLQVRASYRFNENSKWKTVESDPDVCGVSQNRIYLLKEALADEAEQIDYDKVLNKDPSFGVVIPLENYQWFNLYYYQPDMMGLTVSAYEGTEIDQLFTGWQEDGQPVPYYYPITGGRHILEPGEFVPVPEGYTVQLKLAKELNRTFSDKRYSTDIHYLQTLVGYGDEDNGGWDWPDFPEWPDSFPDFFSLFGFDDEDTEDEEPTVLEVPEYVQAVELENAHTVDELVLPDTVRYISFDNLEVTEKFTVDKENLYYCVQNGLLMNAEQTAILGIPSKTKEITVSADVTRIDIPETNDLEKISFAEGCTDVPEMDIYNLASCEIEVNSGELLKKFATAYVDELNDGMITLSYAGSDTGTTEFKNNCMIVNGRLAGVVECGDALMLPNGVTAVGPDSMDYYNESSDELPATVMVMPKNGKAVTLEDGWAEGTNIKWILCYTEEQKREAEKNLDGTTARMILQSAEGIDYVPTLTGNGGESGDEIAVLSAPKDITEFDGTVTEAGTNRPLTVKVVGDDAFMECTRLRWVQLPQSVKTIGYQAFRACYSLEGVLIDSRDEVTIGYRSFDDCWMMRFIASNAQNGYVQNDYVIPMYSTYETSYYDFRFAPCTNTGYFGGWTYFTMPDGFEYQYDHYELVNCGGTKVLYLCMDDGTPWLALRSGLWMDEDTLTLPWETVEIFNYAFAGLEGPSGSFTMPELADITGLYIDTGAFAASEINGELTLPVGATIAEMAFAQCDGITKLTLQDGTSIDNYVFSSCTNLVEVTMGNWAGSLPTNEFYECNNLQTIRFTSDQPSSDLFLGYGSEFNFNNDWAYNEEEQLHLEVPEGSWEAYVLAWRYQWYGSENFYSMWTQVSDDILWSEWRVPDNEEVIQGVKEKLTRGENKLRKMMGLDTVEEATQVYYWHADDDGYITLLETSPDIEVADLSAETLSMPEGWCLDYIAAGAFKNCSNMDMLYAPSTLAGIDSHAFDGLEGLTLMLENEDTPPALMGFEEGEPFTFGCPVEIWTWGWDEEHENLLRSWTLPFTGYESYEKLAAAVQEKWQQENPDAEPDSETIDALIKAALCEAENELRAMLNMELLGEEDDPLVWKDIWQDDLFPDFGPDDGDDDLEPTPDPGDGDSSSEIVDPDLDDGEDLMPTPAPGTDTDDTDAEDPNSGSTPGGPDSTEADEKDGEETPDNAESADSEINDTAGADSETQNTDKQPQAGQQEEEDAV